MASSLHGVIDDPALLNLLGNALQAAESSTELEKIKLQFELKLLADQGSSPPARPSIPGSKPPNEHGSIVVASAGRH
jgi:hypothetical protein